MKRKVYASRRERKIDQIIGFLSFPLVNVPLGAILWIISETTIFSRTSNPSLLLMVISALPWLVNGIVLVLAFRFRLEFGVGYIAFIAIAITATAALSVLFVAACFVIIPLYRVIGDLAILVFVFLIAAGLLGLIVFAIYAFGRWWLSHENTSH